MALHVSLFEARLAIDPKRIYEEVIGGTGHYSKATEFILGWTRNGNNGSIRYARFSIVKQRFVSCSMRLAVTFCDCGQSSVTRT
jgi:hypothetical protein